MINFILIWAFFWNGIFWKRFLHNIILYKTRKPIKELILRAACNVGVFRFVCDKYRWKHYLFFFRYRQYIIIIYLIRNKCVGNLVYCNNIDCVCSATIRWRNKKKKIRTIKTTCRINTTTTTATIINIIIIIVIYITRAVCLSRTHNSVVNRSTMITIL